MIVPERKTLPNFFILGAPKCGTTALAKWLREHRMVYMPSLKEPHFFNTDMDYRIIKSQDAYLRLFEGAKAEHLAIGEASVFYLYSQLAVRNIESAIASPKYVVMFRNPVDMALSFHEQLYVSGNEHIEDFGVAWGLQEQRSRRMALGRTCRDHRVLLYKDVCALGKQMSSLVRTVDKSRVHVIILDDLRENARCEYQKALEFLEIPDDGRTELSPENTAKKVRSRSMHKMIWAAVHVRRRLPIPPIGIGLLSKLSLANQKKRLRPPLKEELRAELSRTFRDDILLLGDIVNRDLSHWVG